MTTVIEQGEVRPHTFKEDKEYTQFCIRSLNRKQDVFVAQHTGNAIPQGAVIVYVGEAAAHDIGQCAWGKIEYLRKCDFTFSQYYYKKEFDAIKTKLKGVSNAR